MLIKEIEIKENQFTRLSTCCFAEIDCGGGGYDGENICPVYDFCKECQTKEPDYILIKPSNFNPKPLTF